MFIDLNDGTWTHDPPDTDDAERTMLAIAAGETPGGKRVPGAV